MPKIEKLVCEDCEQEEMEVYHGHKSIKVYCPFCGDRVRTFYK